VKININVKSKLKRVTSVFRGSSAVPKKTKAPDGSDWCSLCLDDWSDGHENECKGG